MSAPSVAVIIPSFGNASLWTLLGSRALASVAAQTRPPEKVIRWHADMLPAEKLGTFRNSLAAQAGIVDWLIFLDADDELEPTYIEAMLTASDSFPAAEGFTVFIPAVRVLTDTPDELVALPPAIVIPARESLLDGNHIVIGAMIRRELFIELKGFDDYPAAEDWTFWIKAWIAGARMVSAPAAVYRQHWRYGSRNQLSATSYQETVRAIQDKYRPLAKAAWRT
jgi:GT2 family glycosyltransferase